MAEVPSASGPGGAQGPVISQPSRGPRRPSMVLGGLLVLIGAILLAGQFVRVDIGHYGCPFFVIAPGIVILIVALSARGAVSEGLAMILYGLMARRPGNVRSGMRLVGIALVLFLLGAAFFEGIVGISGYQFDHTAGVVLGALIIALGALMLVLNLTSSGRRSR